MIMTEGQIFRCQNRDCGCEVRVLRTSMNAHGNPRCCCGAGMKKPYRKPAFRSLSSDLELVNARSSKN